MTFAWCYRYPWHTNKSQEKQSTSPRGYILLLYGKNLFVARMDFAGRPAAFYKGDSRGLGARRPEQEDDDEGKGPSHPGIVDKNFCSDETHLFSDIM